MPGSNHTSEVHKLRDSTPGGTSNRQCYRCGQSTHRQDSCKFKDSTCHYCGKVGHIRSVCHSRTRNQSSFVSPSSYRSSTVDSPFNRRPSRPSTSRPLSNSSRYLSSTRPFNRRLSRPSYRSFGVKQIAEEPDTTEEYTLFSLPSGSRTPLYVTVSINKSTLKMEVDTGASFFADLLKNLQ